MTVKFSGLKNNIKVSISFFSQVSVRNVFVFPGIPSLMERAFSGLEHMFAGSGTTFYSREVTPPT